MKYKFSNSFPFHFSLPSVTFKERKGKCTSWNDLAIEMLSQVLSIQIMHLDFSADSVTVLYSAEQLLSFYLNLQEDMCRDKKLAINIYTYVNMYVCVYIIYMCQLYIDIHLLI